MDRRNFLEKWFKALEAYGMPREFVSSTYHKKDTFNLSGVDYALVRTIAPNNEQRRELMKKQKPYIPKRAEDSYGLRLDLAGCFLCQNVVQGIDASYFEDVNDNVIINNANSFVMPNRYPSQAGHSLFVPKNHDDTGKRVMPIEGSDRNKIYAREFGKTRGAVVTESSLAEALECFDRENFKALRNHVLDAMSIPGHDHWHLFLCDSPTLSLMDIFAQNAEKTDFGPAIFFAGNTPYDTLLIKARDAQEITPLAVKILEKMETANEVFTLGYSPGNLFISPRYTEKFNNKFHQLGAGVAMHCLSKEDNSELDLAKPLMPLKGEFDWEKFISR